MALDTAAVPLGERSLRRILDYAVAVGDEAETTHLEVKSDLDLGSKNKVGVAKVAKFLLGAANHRRPWRRPTSAATPCWSSGRERTRYRASPVASAHELEDRQPYLGPMFLAFDLDRISVDADREVVFIVAQPPQDGQTIFVRHKSFQGEDRNDNLDAGAIYVRGASDTRPARPGEVQALVERARGGGKPPIKLDVEVLGSIGRVDRVDRVEEVMVQLYELTEKDFIKRQEPAPRTFSFRPPVTTIPGGPSYLSAEDRAERRTPGRGASPSTW